MENTITTLIDQFLKLVKSHVESIMHVLHETSLKVGPFPPNDCFLGDFWVPFLFELQILSWYSFIWLG